MTKNLLGRLAPVERNRIHFGIRRGSDNGEEIVVSNIYSRVSNLRDLQDPRHQKLLDIATLTVTEIVDVADIE